MSPAARSTALETTLQAAATDPVRLEGPQGRSAPDPTRLAANLAAVQAEVAAPKLRLVGRVMRRLGVDDVTVSLVTATPGLRRSWLIAVTIALVFALQAASGSGGEGVDRLVVFLTMAPLVPLLGVALAFGRGVDPTHDIVVAAPMEGHRVFLVRTLTVLTSSTALLLVAALFTPERGPARIAWLLPALAVTAATMALATRITVRRAALTVGGAWLAVIVTVDRAADASTAFGPATQVASAIVAIAATILFFAGRGRLGDIERT